MSEAVLEVHNLNKSFGKNQTLFDVNFQCKTGHIVGMVGANGAGKSTIMKSILCMISSSGKVLLDGEEISFNHHLPLKDVGSLVEYPGIYPFLSGYDHLKLFARNDENKQARIDRVIEEMQMEDYIKKPAKKYSLGMKQKLGIALALLNDPKLVILDEPMNGLDPQANKRLREVIIKRKKNGTTFLISSHILSELQKVAEDVLIVDHGKIVKETTMKELLFNNNHFLILKTNDDEQSQKILYESGYEISETAPLKILLKKSDTVSDILKRLVEHDISVDDLQHQNNDIEDSVLKIIAK